MQKLLLILIVAILLQLALAKVDVPIVAGVFPPETEEPHRVRAAAGVFPPETEEPRRVRAEAGVFPPETEEPHRVRSQAGVFPPETEEPRRERAVAGVFPPETEEPRRVRGVAGVFPPETEEPKRVRGVAGVFPPETEEPHRTRGGIIASSTIVASVSPIVENPVPTWASKGDSCSVVSSCDSCSITDSSYCHYSMEGAARCCQRSIGKIPPTQLVDEPHVAAVTPITENPIPDWASDADACSKKRSCDSCTETQYCKYTFTGKPQCCSPPPSIYSTVLQRVVDAE